MSPEGRNERLLVARKENTPGNNFLLRGARLAWAGNGALRSQHLSRQFLVEVLHEVR